MSRTLPESPRSLEPGDPSRNLAEVSKSSASLLPWNAWLFRIFLIAAACSITLSLSPFGLHRWTAAGLGVLLSLAILLIEHRLRSASATARLGRLAGGLLGAIAVVFVPV